MKDLWTTVKALLLFFLSQMLGIVGTFLIMAFRPGFDIADPDAFDKLRADMDPVLYGMVSLVCTLLLIWILCATRLTSPRPLRSFAKGMPKGWGWSIVGFMLVSFGLSMILDPFSLENEEVMQTLLAMKGNLWCALLLVVAGPVVEELIFRDCITRVLHRSGTILAVVCSAFAFAVIHGNLMQGIPAFFMGVVLALLYLHTGDVRLCIPAHICNNLTSYLQMYLDADSRFLSSWSDSILIIAGVLLLAAGGFTLYVFLHPEKPLQNKI